MDIICKIELDANEVVSIAKEVTGDQSIIWQIKNGAQFLLVGKEWETYKVSELVGGYFGVPLICDAITKGPTAPSGTTPRLFFSTEANRGVGVTRDLLQPTKCNADRLLRFAPIIYKKELDKPLDGAFGSPSPGRFVRLASDVTNYKICVSFYDSGYNHVHVHATSVDTPEVWVHYNDETGEPVCSYAYTVAMRETAASIPNRIALAVGLQADLEAIDAVINQIKEGERFID